MSKRDIKRSFLFADNLLAALDFYVNTIAVHTTIFKMLYSLDGSHEEVRKESQLE